MSLRGGAGGKLPVQSPGMTASQGDPAPARAIGGMAGLRFLCRASTVTASAAHAARAARILREDTNVTDVACARLNWEAGAALASRQPVPGHAVLYDSLWPQGPPS